MTKVKEKAKAKTKSKAKSKAKKKSCAELKMKKPSMPKKLRTRGLLSAKNHNHPDAIAYRKKLVETQLGRKPTTLKDIPEDWQKIMLDLAEEGKGVTAYIVHLGLTRTTFETLLKNEPKFHDTYERCQVIYQLWWEDTGQGMAKGEQGNALVWKYSMGNRFGWADNHNKHLSGDRDNPVAVEVSNKDLSDDELKKQMAERGLPTTIFDE